MREFSLDNKKYHLDYDKRSDRKVKLFMEDPNIGHLSDRYGDQKRIIIKKINALIAENTNINISTADKKYINNYMTGIDRTANRTTDRFGKILYEYLGAN